MRSVRGVLIATVVLIVLGPMVWYPYLRPLLATREVWEGTLVARFQRSYGGDYEYHTCHWRVRCADGRTRTMAVTSVMWTSAQVGAPLRKRKGEHYLRLVGTPNGMNLLQEKMGDEFPKEFAPLIPVPP